MENSNSQIKSLLGAAPADASTAQPLSSPALQTVATNQGLLLQNISKLTETILSITRSWGA